VLLVGGSFGVRARSTAFLSRRSKQIFVLKVLAQGTADELPWPFLQDEDCFVEY